MNRSLGIILILFLVLSAIWTHFPEMNGGSARVIYLCKDDADNSNCTNDFERPCDGEICDLLPMTDLYGDTYFTEKKQSATECCQSCFQDNKCKSFTYDTREQICRLKNKYKTKGTPCPYRISGRPKANLDRPDPQKDGKTNKNAQKGWSFGPANLSQKLFGTEDSPEDTSKNECRRRPAFNS